MSRLNIILFGATGYTGRATIPALYKLTRKSDQNFTWGIAGRSLAKLQNVLQEASATIGDDLSHVPITIADATDEESLNKMASQAQVIINVCGPFRFYGEPVVKACIANSTHHLDISGEPQFMETMQLKYAHTAMLNKCYVVSSCGFDSIPFDLGVVFLEQNFRGKLDSIEAHIKNTFQGKERKGPHWNYATWESAVHGIKNYRMLKIIRKELSERRTKILPESKNIERKRIFKNKLTGHWSVPIPTADASVVRRSQQYFYEKEDKWPVKFDTYYCFDSVSSVIGSLFVYMTLSMLTRSDFGTKLLLRHPKIFSLGVFSHDMPIDEEQKLSQATILLNGRGWLDVNSKQNSDKPKDVIVGCIALQDAAYGNTGTIVTLAAITLLDEIDKLPNNGNGGVFTPAAAFSKTTLLQKLNQNGITFKILSNCKL